MDLGLIDGCEAYGSVESQSGDYAGGVAGICSAAIENCWASVRFPADVMSAASPARV